MKPSPERSRTADSPSESPGDSGPGSYRLLAGEYYDENRHPTCANFRAACRLALEGWLTATWPEKGWVLEVGAGRSLVAEIAQVRKLDLSRIVLLDGEARMLDHSAAFLRAGCHGVVADARHMPFDGQSVSLLVASLGDPFNEPTFWAETRRVVQPGGEILFLTPSYSWACGFRHGSGPTASSAEFETRDAGRILVPSRILPEAEQVAMMNEQGMTVAETMYVSIDQLRQSRISPKLNHAPNGLIVAGYRAMRN